MTVPETFLERNAAFATSGFVGGLTMMPTLRTVVIACLDPRVDPAEVLGLRAGEVAVIRNVGGRVTPDVLTQVALLGTLTRAAGAELGPGWTLVVLQHTQCGIVRMQDDPALPGFLGVPPDGLAAASVADPEGAVRLDLGLLRAAPGLDGATVTGLVYDVATGRVGAVAG